MSHYEPNHRKRGPNWYDVAALAICALLAVAAAFLWITRDEPAGDMLTPVEISQVRQDRADSIQDRSRWEELDAVHSATWDRASSQ